ncbi:MAG: PilZ domain-containing protein [Myxococcales bacterium]
MKRKQSQRKRQTKSANSRSSDSGKRSSVAPGVNHATLRSSSIPAASAAAVAYEAELDAALPREAHLDSGEIEIEPRQRLFGQVDFHTESNFYSGYSGDLSDGGVFVVTYAQLKLGQSVDVELSLPGGLFIAATGRVAFLRSPVGHHGELSPGAGIEFDEIDASSRRAAESFMSRREPTFVDPELSREGTRPPDLHGKSRNGTHPPRGSLRSRGAVAPAAWTGSGSA